MTFIIVEADPNCHFIIPWCCAVELDLLGKARSIYHLWIIFEWAQLPITFSHFDIFTYILLVIEIGHITTITIGSQVKHETTYTTKFR